MTQDQLPAAAQAYGERLAALIFASDLPEEQKQAWTRLLPEMSFEQMDRLTDILEVKVAGRLAEDFSLFRSEMKKIREEFTADVKRVDDKAVADLGAIEQEISKGA